MFCPIYAQTSAPLHMLSKAMQEDCESSEAMQEDCESSMPRRLQREVCRCSSFALLVRLLHQVRVAAKSGSQRKRRGKREVQLEKQGSRRVS